MIETIHINTPKLALALCEVCEISVEDGENPFAVLMNNSTGSNGIDGEFYYFSTHTREQSTQQIKNFYAISRSDIKGY